jgi:histidinol-phosphate phosphatase family protein|tara:strand:- start:1639 stop:2280 length:642 start_codon:yes stop_codon:yes gene_type:complete
MLPPSRDRENLSNSLDLLDLPGSIAWNGKIAFLDRDGVINKGYDNYVNNINEINILPHAGESIARLRRAGFRICVVTNQSPIGRGIWTHENLWIIHEHISKLLLIEDNDSVLDLILYSPYAPWEGAWARKPNPGMLEAGRQIIDHAHREDSSKLKIYYDNAWTNRPDESESIMIGDRNVDYLAAQSYGVNFLKCDPNIGIYDVISSVLGDEDE